MKVPKRLPIAGVVALLGALVVPLGGAPASAAALTCEGKRVTIVGTPGADVIDGTPGPDVIHGLAGGDRIRGLDGDDVICGGRGADTLRGGQGDDTFLPGRGGARDKADRIAYDESPAAIDAELGRGVVRGDGRDRLPRELAGDGQRIYTLVGSPHDDVIQGSRAREVILGIGGDDRIWGAGQVDKLIGGPGDDEMFGQGGADRLEGGPGSDVLHGADGPDVLVDTADSADAIRGGPGKDRISDVLVPAGRQRLHGGDGADVLTFDWRGSASHLVTDLGTGSSRFAGGADTIGLEDFTRLLLRAPSGSTADTMAKGTWTVNGTSAREFIDARTVRLVARGRGGDDQFVSGRFDDFAHGGAGEDVARLGKGSDTCVSIERGRATCEAVS
ncbi:calcium-binding protein [Nocardioides sp. JQ2195]|uniref:calcium-binding protein n=1 Tax=Nocardioides sp. JQ2195 TaxID=2592334 RepID=UPI00143E368C|nr:calcium-binding protein [Nocardioides sp. JQ2195]QIX26005.1 calcium-binding protein [Nocardioides sp. JQ2195]